jgi:hypothetical protein
MLDQRCKQLGDPCGQQDKHKQPIAEERQEAAKAVIAKGCVEQARASHDGCERQLCSPNEKIGSLDAFRVLAERHDLCSTQRTAAEACMAGSDAK